MEVDHADLDDVVRGRGAMLEVDLMAEDVTIVWGKLKLVVVGEPVVTGLVGDLTDSGKSGWGIVASVSSLKSPRTIMVPRFQKIRIVTTPSHSSLG
jgi:hypothetical protein